MRRHSVCHTNQMHAKLSGIFVCHAAPSPGMSFDVAHVYSPCPPARLARCVQAVENRRGLALDRAGQLTPDRDYPHTGLAQLPYSPAPGAHACSCRHGRPASLFGTPRLLLLLLLLGALQTHVGPSSPLDASTTTAVLRKHMYLVRRATWGHCCRGSNVSSSSREGEQEAWSGELTR